VYAWLCSADGSASTSSGDQRFCVKRRRGFFEFAFLAGAFVIFEVGCVEDAAVGDHRPAVAGIAGVELECSFALDLTAQVVADVMSSSGPAELMVA